ncbi:chaperonin 10-like protein [Fennellomyces sp. T-0311]|nr:chaperonin 10-like protein [Fennellomyces sp. T-0311]
MTSSTEVTFHEWASFGKGQPLKSTELQLKHFDDDDIEFYVIHGSVCGSDIHTIDNGWGTADYLCIVGHEIVGLVTKVGKSVTDFKIDDRVRDGCIKILTYDNRWTNGDKSYWRGNQRFVFKIPSNMPSELTATFFCAGVTTYGPLKRNGVTKGSRIGVMDIQWGKAMGAEVVVFSSIERKRGDAKLSVATDYAVISDAEAMAQRAGTLTFMVCTSFANDSKLTLVAAPETSLNNISAFSLLERQIIFAVSFIGSSKMLEFAAKTGVKPCILKYPMTKVVNTIQAMKNGKARY